MWLWSRYTFPHSNTFKMRLYFNSFLKSHLIANEIGHLTIYTLEIFSGVTLIKEQIHHFNSLKIHLIIRGTLWNVVLLHHSKFPLRFVSQKRWNSSNKYVIQGAFVPFIQRMFKCLDSFAFVTDATLSLYECNPFCIRFVVLFILSFFVSSRVALSFFCYHS